MARELPDALRTLADCQHTLRAICESGTKDDFEQESLGAPTLMGWPFYAEEV
jgi:hypothetical protein